MLLNFSNMIALFHTQPNGHILFRDYATGDLAQVRF